MTTKTTKTMAKTAAIAIAVAVATGLLPFAIGMTDLLEHGKAP
jgi:hypothetical protein